MEWWRVKKATATAALATAENCNLLWLADYPLAATATTNLWMFNKRWFRIVIELDITTLSVPPNTVPSTLYRATQLKLNILLLFCMLFFNQPIVCVVQTTLFRNRKCSSAIVSLEASTITPSSSPTSVVLRAPPTAIPRSTLKSLTLSAWLARHQWIPQLYSIARKGIRWQ